MAIDKLSTKQAAEHLGLSPWTLVKWRAVGRGPDYLKMGGKVVYLRAALEAFQASCQVTPTTAAAS